MTGRTAGLLLFALSALCLAGCGEVSWQKADGDVSTLAQDQTACNKEGRERTGGSAALLPPTGIDPRLGPTGPQALVELMELLRTAVGGGGALLGLPELAAEETEAVDERVLLHEGERVGLLAHLEFLDLAADQFRPRDLGPRKLGPVLPHGDERGVRSASGLVARAPHLGQLAAQGDVLLVDLLEVVLAGLPGVVDRLLLIGEASHVVDQPLAPAPQLPDLSLEPVELGPLGLVLPFRLLGEDGASGHAGPIPAPVKSLTPASPYSGPGAGPRGQELEGEQGRRNGRIDVDHGERRARLEHRL